MSPRPCFARHSLSLRLIASLASIACVAPRVALAADPAADPAPAPAVVEQPALVPVPAITCAPNAALAKLLDTRISANCVHLYPSELASVINRALGTAGPIEFCIGETQGQMSPVGYSQQVGQHSVRAVLDAACAAWGLKWVAGTDVVLVYQPMDETELAKAAADLALSDATKATAALHALAESSDPRAMRLVLCALTASQQQLSYSAHLRVAMRVMDDLLPSLRSNRGTIRRTSNGRWQRSSSSSSSDMTTTAEASPAPQLSRVTIPAKRLAARVLATDTQVQQAVRAMLGKRPAGEPGMAVGLLGELDIADAALLQAALDGLLATSAGDRPEGRERGPDMIAMMTGAGSQALAHSLGLLRDDSSLAQLIALDDWLRGPGKAKAGSGIARGLAMIALARRAHTDRVLGYLPGIAADQLTPAVTTESTATTLRRTMAATLTEADFLLSAAPLLEAAAVPKLIATLEDAAKPTPERILAARCLGQRNEAAATEALLRVAAAAWNPAPEPNAMASLPTAQPLVWAVLDTLASRSEARVVPWLCDVAQNAPQARQAAWLLLSRINDTAAVNALLEAAKADALAFAALAETHQPAAVELLVAAATADDALRRITAIAVLPQTRDAAATAALRTMLASETRTTELAALIKAIQTFNDPADMPAILACFERSSDLGLRGAVLDVAIPSNDPAAQALVRKVAKEAPEAQLRLQAVRGLKLQAFMEDSETTRIAIDVLLQVVAADTVAEVRTQAAMALMAPAWRDAALRAKLLPIRDAEKDENVKRFLTRALGERGMNGNGNGRGWGRENAPGQQRDPQPPAQPGTPPDAF